MQAGLISMLFKVRPERRSSSADGIGIFSAAAALLDNVAMGVFEMSRAKLLELFDGAIISCA